MKTQLFAAVALAVSLCTAASAQTLLRGDLVAGLHIIPIVCPTPPDTAVFADDLTHKFDIYAGNEIALDGVGHIYGLTDIAAPLLSVYDVPFHAIHTIDLLEPSSSLTVDDSGRAFVVGESGQVRLYSPDGVLVSSFPLPNVVTPVRNLNIDIAPDHCTLVYLGPDAAAERFDICSGTPLTAVGAGFEAVRALRDGGFAGAIAGRIEYFDHSGRLVASQASPANDRVTALAFGVDGKTLWIATASQIYAMRVGAPAVTASSTVGFYRVTSLAVFGEQRPDPPVAEPKRRSARH